MGRLNLVVFMLITLGPAMRLAWEASWTGTAIVVIGAITGSWIRYAGIQLGTARFPHRHWATLGVNTAACFLMGLLMGLQPRWGESTRGTLELALATGLLGSMSTFSTLVADLLTAWRRQGRRHALALGTASLLGGLLACQLGLALAQGEP